jgi:UDP-MurNAc hydroxylase
MRVTGLGHAGMLIETAGGSVLCDPWSNPAFFGSWFPFPDNSWMDWDALGDTDYLYVSHLHRDHFDAMLLARHVRKDATVLLPDYPTDELELELRQLGFTRFVHTRSGEPVELNGGLRAMITSLTGPSDGPIGDSAISLDDGRTIILNQNDAHPLDIEALKKFGDYHAHFQQFSGAIWWPMVYDLPKAAKSELARRKRVGQDERALRYNNAVGADHMFPTAGPPCFLDEELFDFNGYGFGPLEGQSIFTDQYQFLRHMEHLGRDNGRLLLPGTVADFDGSRCKVAHRHSADEIRTIFEDKPVYLNEYAKRMGAALEHEKATWVSTGSDVLNQLKDWWEPLMKRADRICAGIGGPIRLDIGDRPLVLDFPAREVRDWNGEICRYRLSAPAELVSTNVTRREVDWSNSLFLSLRFTASRVGQYNEYIYTFFKCLSVERIDYVENWYDEQNDDGRDVVLAGWRVQHRCPHLRADLGKFGEVNDKNVLTCNLHGWRFDLENGRCLTAAGHDIRASRIEDAEPSTALVED